MADMAQQGEATGDARPELLVLGKLPDWDMEPLAAQFRILTLWDAPDPAAPCGRWRRRAIAAPTRR
jgi:hypothetical protein